MRGCIVSWSEAQMTTWTWNWFLLGAGWGCSLVPVNLLGRTLASGSGGTESVAWLLFSHLVVSDCLWPHGLTAACRASRSYTWIWALDSDQHTHTHSHTHTHTPSPELMFCSSTTDYGHSDSHRLLNLKVPHQQREGLIKMTTASPLTLTWHD